MDTFEKRKKHALWKMREGDKSKKGSVDVHIKPLLNAINAHPDYYTTSSCAGRILLLCEPVSEKKNAYAWPLVSHEKALSEEFIRTAKTLTDHQGVVWLRMQTAIIHVAARDLACATALLKQFHPHGWKRSGIFSTENDVMIELLSVEGMDAPICCEGVRIVDDAFFTQFIALANKKLGVVHKKIALAAQRVKNL